MMLPKFLLIATISSLALAQVESPLHKPLQWGKRSGPFQLSIACDKDEYRLGEAVRVTATLRNVSDHTVRVERPQSEFIYIMEVRLPIPEWIPWKPTARLTAHGEEAKNPTFGGTAGGVLPPDRERVDEIDLSKLYDMSTPGKYHITFWCHQVPDTSVRQVITVTSNDIMVTVLPKQ